MTATAGLRLYSHHPVADEGFTRWLAAEDMTLLAGAGRRLWVFRGVEGGLSIDELSTEEVTALSWTDDRLVMAAPPVVWSLSPVLDGSRVVLVPQVGWVTGDLAIPQVWWDRRAGPCFISTLFSCAGTVHTTLSLDVLWAPPWISEMRPEDRCHLTGLAVSGTETWCAVAAESDDPYGWKDASPGAGFLFSSSGTRVPDLTLPAAPVPYRDGLVFLDSGTGRLLGSGADSESPRVIARVPGYAERLVVVGDVGLVGYSGLGAVPGPTEGLTEEGDGLVLIDLRDGGVLGGVVFEGDAGPIRSLAVLPGRIEDVAVPRGETAQTLVTMAPTDPI